MVLLPETYSGILPTFSSIVHTLGTLLEDCQYKFQEKHKTLIEFKILNQHVIDYERFACSYMQHISLYLEGRCVLRGCDNLTALLAHLDPQAVVYVYLCK